MRRSGLILLNLVFFILIALSESSTSDPSNTTECVLTSNGCDYQFDCLPGYQLVDNSSCTDVDECQIPGSCSQLCNNTEGSFECSCLEGYIIDPSNDRRCKAEVGHAVIIFTNRIEVRKIDLETSERTVLTHNSAIEIDYDFGDNLVVFGDSNQRSIHSAKFDNLEVISTIVEENITELEGLAVDWIHDNVYWTDATKDFICVASLDGKLTKLLFETDLDEPRAIVVNPVEGWMFWTDWGRKAKIERAGMDGTHRSTIVSKNIVWPNGLTLDFVSKKIYWADAKLNSIYSSDYDGSNIKLILRSSYDVNHPFALDVFEDSLYWTDRGSQKINKMDKFTGQNVQTIASHLYKPTILRVYHSYKQPSGINYCGQNNGGCPYLCLPAPQVTPESAKYTCACPDYKINCDATENTIAAMTTNSADMTTNSADMTINRADMTTNITNIDDLTTIITDSADITTNIIDNSDTTTIVTNSVVMATTITDLTTMTTVIISSPSTFVATTFSSVMTPSQSAQQAFLMNDTLRQTQEVGHNGKIAGIIIGVLGCLVILITAVGFWIYRQHLRRNSRSMHFDNPVYRRTAMDQLSLVKNEYDPTMSYPSSLEP